MAMSDCKECWETPCACGYSYRGYPDHKLVEIFKAVECIVRERSLTRFFYQPETGGEKAYIIRWNTGGEDIPFRVVDDEAAIQNVIRLFGKDWRKVVTLYPTADPL